MLAQQSPAQLDPRNASVQMLGSLSLCEDADRLSKQRLGLRVLLVPHVHARQIGDALTGRAMPVYIDNVPVGRTPLISYKVKAGPHRIPVRVGYRMVNETVQIDSGATVVKSYDAAPR